MEKGKSKNQELVIQFCKSKDESLREEIVVNSVPLVHFVIHRLGINNGNCTDYEDIVSQGLLGLIEAVDHYNPEYDTMFSTYATFRIKGRVLDYLRSLDWLSRTTRQRIKEVQKAFNELWVLLERPPTEEEVAEKMTIDVSKVREALTDASHVVLSLDHMVFWDDEDEVTYHEKLPDHEQNDPGDIVDAAYEQSAIVGALCKIEKRDRLILSLYYFEELTLKEIGKLLNISESRVCQLHARAIMRLKAILINNENTLGNNIQQSKKNNEEYISQIVINNKLDTQAVNANC